MQKQLLPFSHPEQSFSLTINAQMNNDCLAITYDLLGSLSAINLIDQRSTSTKRTHDLWKDTCFEWFLKSPQKKNYWEFNASPSGDWNFYQLDDYRKNLHESPLVIHPKITSSWLEARQEQGHYRYQVAVDLKRLLDSTPHLREEGLLAVTSVVRYRSGEVSYYSLRHPVEKPDFHSNEAFILFLKEFVP